MWPFLLPQAQSFARPQIVNLPQLCPSSFPSQPHCRINSLRRKIVRKNLPHRTKKLWLLGYIEENVVMARILAPNTLC